MKYYFRIIYLLSFVCLVAISCSKKDNDTFSKEIESLSFATNKAILAPNLETLKQSVTLLSDNERKDLWELKFQTILEKDKLSTEQRNIIQQIKSFLDNTSFDYLRKNQKESDAFLKSNLPNYKKHFDAYQIYMLIECSFFCKNFSIFNAEKYLNKLDNRSDRNIDGDSNESNLNAPAVSNCSCYYSVYCETTPHEGGNSCIDGGCKKVGGCGMFGGTNCSGKCK